MAKTTKFVEFKAGIMYVGNERVKMDIRNIPVKDEKGKMTKGKLQKLSNYFNKKEDVLREGSKQEKVQVISKIEQKVKKAGLTKIANFIEFKDNSVTVTIPRACPELSYAMAEAAFKNEFTLHVKNHGFAKTLRSYHRLMKLVDKAPLEKKVSALKHVEEFMENFTRKQRQVISQYYEAMKKANKYYEKHGYKIGSFMK